MALADEARTGTHTAVDESDLIAQAIAGSGAAFEALYQRHFPRVYTYVRALSRSDEDAADLVQQTFLRTWRGLAGYRRESGFATWLFSIARRCVIDAHRRRHDMLSWESLPADEHPAPSVPLDQRLQAVEAVEQLQRLIARLPPERRDLLVLRFVAQLSVREIAEVVDKRPEAVKKQLLRTLRALKEQYHDLQDL